MTRGEGEPKNGTDAQDEPDTSASNSVTTSLNAEVFLFSAISTDFKESHQTIQQLRNLNLSFGSLSGIDLPPSAATATANRPPVNSDGQFGRARPTGGRGHLARPNWSTDGSYDAGSGPGPPGIRGIRRSVSRRHVARDERLRPHRSRDGTTEPRIGRTAAQVVNSPGCRP